jgi:predicted transcriptional regulator
MTSKFAPKLKDPEIKQKVFDLHSQGLNATQIAKRVGVAPPTVNNFLKRNNLENNVQLKIDEKIESNILELHHQGLIVKTIAEELDNISEPSVRKVICKHGLDPNYKVFEKITAKCHICGKEFTPKYHKKERRKLCSEECMVKFRFLPRKYDDESVIKRVVELKSKLTTNEEIVTITGVKLNKVKEIVKENNLLLAPEERQLNAYRKKIEKNPKAMEVLRSSRMKKSIEEYERSLVKIKRMVKKGQGSVGGIAKAMGMNQSSVVESFYKRGWGSLVIANGNTSTPQCEIYSFIKDDLGMPCENNNRKIIKPLELDIVIESKKVAIEFCGLYWHCEKTIIYNSIRNLKNKLQKKGNRKEYIELELERNMPNIIRKSKYYHLNKLKDCQDKGYRLITIFEDEWNENREVVKNYISNCLGLSKKINGRDTKIVELDKKTAHKFLNSNHIQGTGSIHVCFGLYFKEELVAVMSGSHSRRGNNDDLILDRMVFKSGIYIPGGASKLFKKLKEYAKNKGYLGITSWSDNRWSEGKVYQSLGFKLINESKPDYSYITNLSKTERKSKQSNQKRMLIKNGGIGNTESEMAESLNYLKIWDCGKKTWRFSLTP